MLMPTFFEIRHILEECDTVNSVNVNFFMDKKSRAYHEINQLAYRKTHYSLGVSKRLDNPPNPYKITFSEDAKNKLINTLYHTGDQKNYEFINFQNKSLSVELDCELMASFTNFPLILAKMARLNPASSDFQFYAQQFNMLQELKSRMEAINRLFIFSDKGKEHLNQAAKDFYAFLKEERGKEEKYKQFLNSFLRLTKEIEENSPFVSKQLGTISRNIIATGLLLCSISATSTLIFLILASVGSILLPALVVSAAVLFLSLSVSIIATFYRQHHSLTYHPNDNSHSLSDLHKQATFFTQTIKGEQDDVLPEVKEPTLT
jgi:hypothetical protein